MCLRPLAFARVRPVGDDGEVSVLQYNPPYTVPWRRRNEVAVVVERVAAESAEPAATEQTEAEADVEAAPEAASPPLDDEDDPLVNPYL